MSVDVCFPRKVVSGVWHRRQVLHHILKARTCLDVTWEFITWGKTTPSLLRTFKVEELVNSWI